MPNPPRTVLQIGWLAHCWNEKLLPEQRHRFCQFLLVTELFQQTFKPNANDITHFQQMSKIMYRTYWAVASLASPVVIFSMSDKLKKRQTLHWPITRTQPPPMQTALCILPVPRIRNMCLWQIFRSDKIYSLANIVSHILPTNLGILLSRIS